MLQCWLRECFPPLMPVGNYPVLHRTEMDDLGGSKLLRTMEELDQGVIEPAWANSAALPRGEQRGRPARAGCHRARKLVQAVPGITVR